MHSLIYQGTSPKQVALKHPPWSRAAVQTSSRAGVVGAARVITGLIRSLSTHFLLPKPLAINPLPFEKMMGLVSTAKKGGEHTKGGGRFGLHVQMMHLRQIDLGPSWRQLPHQA